MWQQQAVLRVAAHSRAGGMVPSEWVDRSASSRSNRRGCRTAQQRRQSSGPSSPAMQAGILPLKVSRDKTIAAVLSAAVLCVRAGHACSETWARMLKKSKAVALKELQPHG